MELEVQRKWFTRASTIGELLIDGAHECWTLEDVVRPRGVKIPGQTAIPSGRYQVVIDESKRFGCKMPHVLYSPSAGDAEFSGIRIHCGNTDKDTEGCLLVGEQHGTNIVGASRVAFAEFFAKLKTAIARNEEVWITYRDIPAPDSQFLPPITDSVDVNIAAAAAGAKS